MWRDFRAGTLTEDLASAFNGLIFALASGSLNPHFPFLWFSCAPTVFSDPYWTQHFFLQ